MQIICSSRSFNFIKKNINNPLIKGFILCLENFCLFNEYSYSQEEIKEVIEFIKNKNKNVIIDIAKIIHEEEIKKVEEIIVWLNSINVDYFMYSDFGVQYILEKLGLKNKAMLYSNTYLTNTFDVKIYQEKNGMVVLSNQINADELIKIANDSYDNKLISAFGKALIMYTRRPLLKNYFKYRDSKKDSSKVSFSLQEEYRKFLYYYHFQ